jgi:SAM-dependent methyltransferase
MTDNGPMSEDLDDALMTLRPLLLDADLLVRAVAAGRRRGAGPTHQRAELRPVELKAGRRLQLVCTPVEPGRGPVTRNLAGADAEAAIDVLLAEPFANWHVETADRVVQLRVTKKGRAQVHVARTSRRDVQARTARTGHDRVKERLLDPADPLFDALGADADKRRQVDAFLRLLAPTVDRALAPARAAGRPLHVVDLGCGNAYLTFAAHRYLSGRAGDAGVRTVGIDQRPDMVARNTDLASRLGLAGLHFQAGSISGADPGRDGGPAGVDLVLALHACDTATDDALARAVRWHAPVLLAAPCCHHDVQRQLAARQAEGVLPPHPYAALTRHGILRERFADVLTDALRAGLLRLLGYRVDVVEFVDSRHTPRNALIRAEFTGVAANDARRAEYLDLAAAWQLRPRLGDLLDAELAPVLDAELAPVLDAELAPAPEAALAPAPDARASVR